MSSGGFQAGSEVLGWKIIEADSGGPAPRFAVTRGNETGTLCVFPFKGTFGPLHQRLAETLRRCKDLSHANLVPVGVELRDRAVLLLQPQVEALGDEPLETTVACEALLNLAEALSVFHDKGHAHGEIDAWSVVVADESYRLQPPGQRVVPASTRRLRLSVEPTYAAPEVLDGQSATPASDVFSLGLVLYRLLTGKAPAEGQGTSAIFAARGETPAPPLPSDAGKGALALYAKMTALRIEARQQNAHELVADLRALLERGQEARRNPLPKAEFEPARIGTPLTVVIVLLVLTAGIGAYCLKLAPTSPAADYVYSHKTRKSKTDAKTSGPKTGKTDAKTSEPKTGSAQAPAKSDEAETPAKTDEAEAPAKTDGAETPAKSDEAETPAKTDEPKAPAKTEEPKAPAKTVPDGTPPAEDPPPAE